jgi:hypothetical protein
MHLVGFTIGIYYEARTNEVQINIVIKTALNETGSGCDQMKFPCIRTTL